MKNTHASALRSAFRALVLASAGLPVASLIACGGGVDTGASGGSCQAVTSDAAVPSCGTYTRELTGDLNACAFKADGKGDAEYCRSLCGSATSCERVDDRVVCTSDDCFVVGRRYAELDDRTAPAELDVGSHLARLSFFEAASVDSFALLERELAAHRAPAALVGACRRARRDEVRHARMTARLARRLGAVVSEPPALAEAAPRSLEAIAIENAVEGCVRETFGVLVGLWQAEHAPTPALRALFGALAHDEARHAALAARIDAWILPRLSPSSRRRVEAARAQAFASLEASVGAERVAGVGLPSAAEARALFAGWRALPLAA